MIIKRCTKCGKYFPYCSSSLCPECREVRQRKQSDKLYNQKIRNKETDRFYHSRAWKELSKRILLKANAIGQGCAVCHGLATEVHHIEEVKDCPEKRLDESNLIPLCTKCHNSMRL